jgi:hypothetical protein
MVAVHTLQIGTSFWCGTNRGCLTFLGWPMLSFVESKQAKTIQIPDLPSHRNKNTTLGRFLFRGYMFHHSPDRGVPNTPYTHRRGPATCGVTSQPHHCTATQFGAATYLMPIRLTVEYHQCEVLYSFWGSCDICVALRREFGCEGAVMS